MPKTAASVGALALMMALGSAAMAQTTPSMPNGSSSSTGKEQSPAAQVPPEKMPAEKVMPSPKQAASADGQVMTQSPNTVLASDLVNKTVYGPDQKKIGTVNDIILKQDGSGVDGVVVGIGGFLGLGEHNVALKMDKFTIRPTENGRTTLVLNSTREELEKVPAFKSKSDQDADAARNAPRPSTSTPKAPSH